MRVDRFKAIEDCDAALAGEGEFSFVVWVWQGTNYNIDDRLVVRGNNVEPIELSDGESYAIDRVRNFNVFNENGLSVRLFASEYDILFAPDPRMDNRSGDLVIPLDAAGRAAPGQYSFVVGQDGCKVQLDVTVSLT